MGRLKSDSKGSLFGKIELGEESHIW